MLIHLRRCLRCGHFECPCCKDWCDVCIDDDAICGDMECAYEDPPDEVGYALLARELEAHRRARGSVLDFSIHVAEDGGVEIRTFAEKAP